MLTPSLCDYNYSYILVKVIITIAGRESEAAAIQAHEWNKGVIFKNCTPFTDCISAITNTQINNAKDLDAAMIIYNLGEYSDNYSDIPVSLWHYYSDEPNATLADSESFKCKVKTKYSWWW